jgi:hypothetical protein
LTPLLFSGFKGNLENETSADQCSRAIALDNLQGFPRQAAYVVQFHFIGFAEAQVSWTWVLYPANANFRASPWDLLVSVLQELALCVGCRCPAPCDLPITASQNWRWMDRC